MVCDLKLFHITAESKCRVIQIASGYEFTIQVAHGTAFRDNFEINGNSNQISCGSFVFPPCPWEQALELPSVSKWLRKWFIFLFDDVNLRCGARKNHWAAFGPMPTKSILLDKDISSCSKWFVYQNICHKDAEEDVAVALPCPLLQHCGSFLPHSSASCWLASSRATADHQGLTECKFRCLRLTKTSSHRMRTHKDFHPCNLACIWTSSSRVSCDSYFCVTRFVTRRG